MATNVSWLISISPNSLILMRSSGQLNFSKVGGIYYYNMTEIERLMQTTLKNN